MIFNSGWSRSEIEDLTYKELFEYVQLYDKMETEKWFDFFKLFAINNFETTLMATNGKKGAIQTYFNSLVNRKLVLDSENNIDDQFKGVEFVE